MQKLKPKKPKKQLMKPQKLLELKPLQLKKTMEMREKMTMVMSMVMSMVMRKKIMPKPLLKPPLDLKLIELKWLEWPPLDKPLEKKLKH